MKERGNKMLKQYYPYAYADSVFAIDYQKIYEKGYRGILFDIDNTLVHHGDDSTPEIDALFQKIQKTGLRTVLLTNNDEERVKRFIKNIDTLYICDADKPDPQGCLKAAEILGVNIEKTSGEVIEKQLTRDNHSEVMYDYDLIPAELIR